MTKVKVAVAGATGYAGAELVRYLLGHPYVDLVMVAGSGRAGGDGADAADQPSLALAAALPGLRGLTTLALTAFPQRLEAWPAVDAIFLAMPHGVSTNLVHLLPKGPKVVDLAGDFRRQSPSHPFVYGLVENRRNVIKEATHVASPGCFATACILALSPLVKQDLIEGRVIIDAKTGSSGAGAKAGPTTHHPERAHSLFAYKMFKHQHGPEIDQALRDVAPQWTGKVILQAHATPLVRGIFASVYARLAPGVTAPEVEQAFASHYAGSPFVRLSPGASPNVLWSRGTNFADIGWAVDGDELAVFAAIDNLGKGAAGQAVQSFNLMFGWPETTGLWAAGGIP